MNRKLVFSHLLVAVIVLAAGCRPRSKDDSGSPPSQAKAAPEAASQPESLGVVEDATTVEIVSIIDYEAAGISGLRALWDIPVVLGETGRTIEQSGHPTALWLPEERTDQNRRVGYGELMAASLGDAGERLAEVTQDGALAFDALHRKLLVRFPDAAQTIADKMADGYVVVKVELALPFRDTELQPYAIHNTPFGYAYRMNWGVGEWWRRIPPNWHAIAWALRHPWTADNDIGPTYNAYIRGAGYWSEFEARDETRDRFPLRFGPAEVSYEVVNGRLDITELLRDPQFGASLGERLRVLSDRGFLVAKWELYDHRYYGGPYEWATGTGGRAILIDAPRLEVSFSPGRAPRVELPPAADVRAMAERLRREGADGHPTAVIPDRDGLRELIARSRPVKPAWMADWQWDNLQTVFDVGSPGIPSGAPFWWQYVPAPIRNELTRRFADQDELRDRAAYAAWIDVLLSRQPRGWEGFSAGDMLFPLFAFADALPKPVLDYKQLFWECWLMPDRPTAPVDRIWDDSYNEGPMIHPQIGSLRPSRQVEMQWGPGHGEMYPHEGAKPEDAFDTYYALTGDWRGNKSFYRSGYLYSMSTMNFNNMAAMAALLGGTFIDAEIPIRDGRHGMEHWPLRTWSWLDGTTQESIDHYYLGHTLSAQKMVKDFAYGEFDRMIGAAMVAKTMEELMTGYHPGLRRLIANSTRTNIEQVLGMQEGIYAVLHMLSPSGTLRELDQERLVANMQVVGHNYPPAKVARQSLTGPWAPEWMRNVVDKPLPFRSTSAFTQWGGRRDHPVWRRAYMGRHYGMATIDLMNLNIETLIQWRRADRQVDSARDLGTLMVYSDVNDTQFSNLWLKPAAIPTLQHDNKLILLGSPYGVGNHHAHNAPEGVRSIQLCLALFNFEDPEPSWSIYVDDRQVEQLPVAVQAGQRIVIRDGVTYLGIIPLPATDLGGRDAEVRIEPGVKEGHLYTALMIQAYNLRRETPLKVEDEALRRAYAGFVIELGDASEYASFEDFQAHLRAVEVETRWDDAESTVHVSYASAGDRLEMGFKTTYPSGGQSPRGFAYRRVNGQWPYLAPGILRETTVSQQGVTGRLEKHGFVLRSSPGGATPEQIEALGIDPTHVPAVVGSTMAYLIADPQSRSCQAWNALPDPSFFSLSAPDGIEVTADGKVGLLAVDLRGEAGEIAVGYAARDDQDGDEMAQALLLFGFNQPPLATLNGQAFDPPLASVDIDGLQAYVLPLHRHPSPEAGRDTWAERYAHVLRELAPVLTPAGEP